jgi:hypothetical protein
MIYDPLKDRRPLVDGDAIRNVFGAWSALRFNLKRLLDFL